MRIHLKNDRPLTATAATAFLLTALMASSALAGGFAVREQSAEFQGMSFAGAGTGGGGLSSMFWNPATAAYAPAGMYSESHYAFVMGDVEMTALPGTTALIPGVNDQSGDIARDAIVPSSYGSLRINDKMVLAISINSPFGLVTKPENRDWAGSRYARTSEIKTYNFAPTLAYAVSPQLAIGVGLQIQKIEGRLKSALPPGTAGPNIVLEGDDFALGLTAGLDWKVGPGTSFGLGWRSAIDHTLEGSLFVAGVPGIPSTGIKADVDLPDIVTASFRHALHANMTLLGSVEWSNWSRLGDLNVNCQQITAVCPTGLNRVPLGWSDGWMFALGAEYRHQPNLMLRAGLAYEISPIDSAEGRTPRVPDADRIWASIGATYQYNEKTSLDFAYTHIFVEDAKIDRLETVGRLVADVNSSVNIFSVSMKMKMGDVPHSYAPMK